MKKTKQFTLLQLFSIVDGRLAKTMDDVYDILGWIFNDNLSTISLCFAAEYLRKNKPEWYFKVEEELALVDEICYTRDYDTMISYIENHNRVYDVPQL